MGVLLILIGLLFMLESLIPHERSYVELFTSTGRMLRNLYRPSPSPQEFRGLLNKLDRVDTRDDEIMGQKMCLLDQRIEGLPQ